MRTTTAIAAFALLAVTAPALAETADMTTRSVRISDLDLATPAGKAALRYRIGRAIEGVCGSYATTAEPSAQDAIGACRAQVRSGVDRQIAARARTGAALASAR